MKKTPSYAAVVADTARRYWPLWVFAASVLIGAALLFAYLNGRADLAARRQRLDDQRAERQRQAICAILANIPGQVPTEIRHARQVFAAHRGECNPIKGATPPPQTVHVTINGKPGVIVVNPTPSPQPSSTTTSQPPPRPTHTPRPTRSPQPSMTPTPSPTCLNLVSHAICVK